MEEVNYRYNSKNELITKDIIEYIRTFNYGDLISYEVLARRIGLNIEFEEHKKLFKRIMQKAKNILIDYSYVLKSVGGKGYYILKSNQISSYTYRNYIVKPLKSYEKAKRILKRTDKSSFSNLDSEEHTYITELNNQMIRVSEYTLENSNYFENKDKYEVNNYDRKSN